MTIANQITIKADKDQTKTVKNILNTLAETALLEKGCQKFELYQLDKGREHFFIIEIWKSAKRYNDHLNSSAYFKLREELEPLIEEEISQALKLTQCLTKLGLKEKKETK